jgi:hypothetical protein
MLERLRGATVVDVENQQLGGCDSFPSACRDNTCVLDLAA